MSNENKKILLAHGGGGRLTSDLIEKVILPRFANETLSQLTDAAAIELESTSLCFTTDSFVVKPLVFAGGDIGELAICGTVNDLAVSGAKPVGPIGMLGALSSKEARQGLGVLMELTKAMGSLNNGGRSSKSDQPEIIA